LLCLVFSAYLRVGAKDLRKEQEARRGGWQYGCL
jgi:hypothetical protein